MAGRPGDRYPLFDGFPLARTPDPRPIDQNHRIALRAHVDPAGRFSATRPRGRKILAGVQPAFAMPATHVDRDTGLTGGAATAGRPSHQAHSPLELFEIIWQMHCLETAAKHEKKGCIFSLFVRDFDEAQTLTQDRSILMNHAMTESASRCSLQISSASFGSVAQHEINARFADAWTAYSWHILNSLWCAVFQGKPDPSL